jgi:hypothetical protein
VSAAAYCSYILLERTEIHFVFVNAVAFWLIVDVCLQREVAKLVHIIRLNIHSDCAKLTNRKRVSHDVCLSFPLTYYTSILSRIESYKCL